MGVTREEEQALDLAENSLHAALRNLGRHPHYNVPHDLDEAIRRIDFAKSYAEEAKRIRDADSQ